MYDKILAGAAGVSSGSGSTNCHGGSTNIVAGNNDTHWTTYDNTNSSVTTMYTKCLVRDSANGKSYIITKSNVNTHYIIEINNDGSIQSQTELLYSSGVSSVTVYGATFVFPYIYMVGAADGYHWACKFDTSTRTMVWDRSYTQNTTHAWNRLQGVAASSTSHLYVCGNAHINQFQEIIAAKLNVADGSILWTKRYHPGQYSTYPLGNKIKLDSAGNPVVVGHQGHNGIHTFWLNSLGDIQSVYTLVSSTGAQFHPSDFDFASNGDVFVIGGVTANPWGSNWSSVDTVIIKADDAGHKAIYSETAYDTGNSISINTGNDIAYITNSTNSSPAKFWVAALELYPSISSSWTREFKQASDPVYMGNSGSLIFDNNNLCWAGYYANACTGNQNRTLYCELAADGTGAGSHGAFDYSAYTYNTASHTFTATNETSSWSAVNAGLTGIYASNLLTVNNSTTDISLLEQKVITNVTPTTYSRLSSTGSLFKGASSTGSASSGWTILQSISKDDGFHEVPLGFNWTINNTQYNSVFVGSNNYITFGSGQTQYSAYSFVSWAIPKIILTMTSDNSYQYLTYKQFTDYTRIRFEGNSSTSGTVGAGDIVWEATFFVPSAVNGKNIVEIRCGVNGRGTSYTMGIAGPSNSTAYASHSSLVNESVVYEGDSTGTTWTAYVGSKMDYSIGL